MLPILICGQGRTGTTALMKLLGTSQDVFCDPVYPHEKRYLTYWAKLAELLNRDVAYGEFRMEDLANFEVSRLGRFPWYYDDHYEKSNWPPSPADWLAGFWRAFTELVRQHHGAARLYAEKSPSWLPALVRESFPCEVIYLIRDPRDVCISARMFHARDTGFLSGLQNPYDQNELLHRTAFAFIQIYENYVSDRQRPDTICLRYEDYVCSLESQVAELEKRFRVSLKIEESQRQWSQHGTAPTLAASVRRWETEGLDAGISRKLVHCVGREMRALAYDTSTVPADDCQALEFSLQSMSSLPAGESEDGQMTLEQDCARIEVWGSDYWFTLPVQDFDAAAIDHIWVSLRAGAGNTCTIYWRDAHQQFSEERAFYVEYRAHSAWRVLDFPLYRHRLWCGRIAAIRIDLFNRAQSGFGKGLSASPECRGTGYLRWVRLLCLAGH